MARSQQSRHRQLPPVLETIDAERGGGFDGIDGWRIDYSISFEGMPVKFVGAKRYELHLSGLAKNTEMDVEAIAYRYFCDVTPYHLTLDFAFHETDKRHVVIECSPNSSHERLPILHRLCERGSLRAGFSQRN